LTQKGNNNILNNLKVAHEKFTWNGKEIPHIGSYGGHGWHGIWLKDLDAREAFPLSTEFRLARFYVSKHEYQPIHQVLHDEHSASVIKPHTVFLVNRTHLLENI